MKLFTMRSLAKTTLAMLLLGGLAAQAQAEVVTQKLFESTTLVTGTSMNLTELNVAAPGTLLIELDDLKWPAALGTLSFALTDARSMLKTFVGTGVANNTWSFDVAAPGTFYGSIFAKPAPGASAGMYYAKVSYQNVAPAPVPLPAAAWLLISGIAGLAAFRPKLKLSQTFA